MSDVSTITRAPVVESRGSDAFAATISKNVLASLARVTAVSLIAAVLPPYLTHHLSVETYAAWVLILQLGAYVSYLDLGIQTAVSKFVAEYEARRDYEMAGHHASASLALMIAAGVLGFALTAFLAWQVPALFASMPANLYREVRISTVLVGGSLSFGLVCAVYSAVFLGLQRYWIPTTITIVHKASFAAAVLIIVALHGNLAVMGLAVAIVNITAGIVQVAAWKREASHIPVSIMAVRPRVLKHVARFCSLQSGWVAGMLCVTGLDIAIVGHYDYLQAAYYSIATLPTNLMLLTVAAALGPLMPAFSAMSTRRSPEEMGNVLVRTTRYGALILLLLGLPLIFCGFSILRRWVGPEYALHTFKYLQILVLANIIRNLCAPYANMICGVGRQETAMITALSEAAVNLGSSLYLASRMGATGVALGTLIGSFVSVSLHFVITMHYTRANIAVSRRRLLVEGLLHPAIILIPSLVLLLVQGSPTPRNLDLVSAVVWGISTLLLAWFVALNTRERRDLFAAGSNWRMALIEKS
jgi:O-antigen/teichoic acid export membrane protein